MAKTVFARPWVYAVHPWMLRGSATDLRSTLRAAGSRPRDFRGVSRGRPAPRLRLPPGLGTASAADRSNYRSENGDVRCGEVSSPHDDEDIISLRAEIRG